MGQGYSCKNCYNRHYGMGCEYPEGLFLEIKMFLVIYFKNKYDDGEVIEPIDVVTANSTKSLLDIIDDAKKNNKKITVYEVGPCILDWS